MISAQTARRAVWRPLWQLPSRVDLILSLTKRELAARYRGSILGIVWALFDRKKRCWHDLVAGIQPIEVARL